MNQSTRSWSSQTRIRRCASGRLQVAEGGKATLAGGSAGVDGGLEALGGEEAVGEHHQREVTVEAVPAPTLVVIEPALPLSILVELLDDPARVGQLDQPSKRRVFGQVG